MAKIIKYKNSDLLKSNATVLCHQVNCKGVMGSGIAATIKEQFPNVFRAYQNAHRNGNLTLGSCQLVGIKNKNGSEQFIANLAGQQNFGRELGRRYTSYDGVYNALENLRRQCRTNLTNCKSIAFPYKFGCDRGGASWNVIIAMIEDVFKNDDITIEIHALKDFD